MLIKGLKLNGSALLFVIFRMLFPWIQQRTLHTTQLCNHVMKLTRLRVVDNSEIGKQAMAEGKPPRCIHVYNKVGVGTIG